VFCALLAASAPPAEVPGRAPVGKKPADARDAARLRALSLRLKDWKESAAAATRRGLGLRGVLIPDAVSFKIASTYLALRGQGHDHSRAVAQLAKTLPRWDRYEKNGLLVLELHNEKFELTKTDRRVFTFSLDRSFVRQGLQLLSARGRRLPVKLAGKPSNLRQEQLVVKKFWVTRDGLTRRVRPRDDPARDPGSIGRDSYLKKAGEALILEKGPSQLEILVSREHLERTRSRVFRLRLHNWKRYEGPFEKNVLDLNENRRWDPLSDVSLVVELPPAGMAISPEIQALVGQVRASAAEIVR
jgi:hypothetical protein